MVQNSNSILRYFKAKPKQKTAKNKAFINLKLFTKNE